ncbi:MAG: SH3 domain-containing protein [Labilithrix sp.]|nr:SH3 domain-containing protein [Labilithrix sp.]
MVRSPLLRALGFALVALSACAAPLEDGETGAEAALSGRVAEGTVVETTTALRIRRTPSTESSANILGLLPVGTEVRVMESLPTNGFYKVELLDEGLARKIKQRGGWVFGEYLTGEGEEPELPADGEGDADGDQDPDGDATPEPVRELTARFVSKNCVPMKDDQNQYMRPTIDEFVINGNGNVTHAALGINSDALPYGTLVRIPEIDQKQAIANRGRSVLFKVVKTGDAPASEPLTATLCTMASGFLPPAGSEITLQIVSE